MDRRSRMLSNHKLLRVIPLTVGMAIIVSVVVPLQSLRAQMGGGGMGGGMGGSQANNMGNGMGGVMLVSGDKVYRPDGTLLRISDAISIATQYLNSIPSSGLMLDEIEEW